MSTLPPSLHKNHTCQVHQWPPYCQSQWSNLGPSLDLSAAFDWLVLPFLLTKCFLLASGIAHTLWFSSSVTGFSSVSFVSSSSLVHFGAPQGAALGLDLFSVSSLPGDLLPSICQQPSSYSSITDLSLNAILLYSVTTFPWVSNKHLNDDKSKTELLLRRKPPFPTLGEDSFIFPVAGVQPMESTLDSPFLMLHPGYQQTVSAALAK